MSQYQTLVRILDQILHEGQTTRFATRYSTTPEGVDHLIGRYKYRVILLANLPAVPPERLSRLVGGFSVDTFGYERCYSELVFPVVTGTYFNAADLTIHVDPRRQIKLLHRD